MGVDRRVDRGHVHQFLKCMGVYCVMFQSVFEVKVPCVLTDHGICLMEVFCNYSTNSPNWHSVYILSMPPHFLCRSTPV